MISVVYKPLFVRQFSKFSADIQNEIIAKIELFKDTRNHKTLRVHKLHGPLDGKWSFSVDFGQRIIFKYINKNEVALLVVGDHSVYD